MGKIEKILKKGPVEGQTTEVYPVTSTKAVYDENNKRLDNIITGLQESVYLNTPIPISTENTPEAKAQNVKNIADYVEKAKAAGIADVNGMAVTCLIKDENQALKNSGIGYLYGEDTICGILVYDDALSFVFTVISGNYIKYNIIKEGDSNVVDSSMLAKGARKPIILTIDTTEVDEETYQKLLSDDVDVLFNTGYNPCTLTYKTDSSSAWKLYFTCFSMEAENISDLYLYAYEMDITKTSPHTCSISENFVGSFVDFINEAGYLTEAGLKPIFNPVLQEIDLTGTDADRKAKLDQFAVDWKALTGANYLTGARFVGKFVIAEDIDRNVTGIMTYCVGDGVDDTTDNCFYGICNGYSFGEQKSQIAVKVSCTDGSLTITQLFSHLEAITIQTLNIPANKKKNSDAIQAYVNNLEGIGVDVTKGYTIPIKTVGFEDGVGVIYPNVDKSYKGICIANGHSYIITISKDGTWNKQNLLDTESDYTILNTSAKDILGAINEINTLANNKQDTLTSGTNIKTINNQSLLGSGNIEISAPSITVDTSMSDTSTNPVQNKVIKAYIDGLVGNVTAQLAQI